MEILETRDEDETRDNCLLFLDFPTEIPCLEEEDPPGDPNRRLWNLLKKLSR